MHLYVHVFHSRLPVIVPESCIFSFSLPFQVIVGARGRSMVPGYEDSAQQYFQASNFQIGPPRQFFFDDINCFTAEQQETVTFVLGTSFTNAVSLRMSVSQQLASIMNVTVDRFHLDVRKIIGIFERQWFTQAPCTFCSCFLLIAMILHAAD